MLAKIRGVICWVHSKALEIQSLDLVRNDPVTLIFISVGALAYSLGFIVGVGLHEIYDPNFTNK
jgi:hypothetical protein